MSIIINSLATHPHWEMAHVAAGGFAKPEGFIGYLKMQDCAGYGNPLQLQPLNAPAVAVQQTESALQTKNRNKGKSRKNQNDVCTNCKKHGHTMKACWAPGGGNEANRPEWYKVQSKQECAHITTESVDNMIRQRAELDRKIAESTRTREYTNMAVDSGLSSTFRQRTLISSEGLQSIGKGFIVDSGVTSHMTNDCSNFTTYENVSSIGIETAKKGDKLYAIGIGSMSVTVMHEGKEVPLIFQNVLHIP